MLTLILQTLAELLAGGTTLTSTEQIDFSHPASLTDQNRGSLLNVYLYDIRESRQMQQSGRQRHSTGERQGSATVSPSPTWFDISIIITAIDRTALGEYHLLSEALSFLLRHNSLREEFLPPELRGYGNLTMNVSLNPAIEIGGLWSALSVPLRPAIHLTLTVPIEPRKISVPVVWERVFGMQHSWQEMTDDKSVKTKRVAIVGTIKSSVTMQPIAEVEVMLLESEKVATSDPEGLFFFENLSFGNYVLRLSCQGYQSQNCNVLVDSPTYTFKEIVLTPV
ncbi:MAG: hypothetical protein N4J56_006865 [Chroococcidiopsis sp. SAG 2025]|uniref:Pvc16 family protein n=1 Tax=Chroococcidiopsis sp. SAG 2025 TaxID=171389 RepID=UPI002937468C|nr:Pvc16 family protein [Chroococcidiopsis sp. SAG 2025]MDV2997160.1 hypothetical protein [Chroococcidiopsis sp. SAG 2025]